MKKLISEIFEGKDSSLRKTYDEAVKTNMKIGKKKQEIKECLIISCKKTAKIRGLCSCCYTNASYAVKAGRTTWAFLEKNNLSSKPLKYSSKFILEFEKIVPRQKLKGKEHLSEK